MVVALWRCMTEFFRMIQELADVKPPAIGDTLSVRPRRPSAGRSRVVHSQAWLLFFRVLDFPVKHYLVVAECVSEFCGYFLQTGFDGLILEFGDSAGLQTDDMIVVVAGVQFEECLATIKMMARDQAGSFKLGQHPIDGCQAYFIAIAEQCLVDIFRAHVVLLGFFQNFQNADARERNFQSGLA